MIENHKILSINKNNEIFLNARIENTNLQKNLEIIKNFI